MIRNQLHNALIVASLVIVLPISSTLGSVRQRASARGSWRLVTKTDVAVSLYGALAGRRMAITLHAGPLNAAGWLPS